MEIKRKGNSRQKRKTAYKAKNEKNATPRMNLEIKGNYLDFKVNHKIHDIKVNADRNSRIKNKFAGHGSYTKKYACGIQHL